MRPAGVVRRALDPLGLRPLEENVRYFPALLPITDEGDPVAVFDAGGVPQLSELRLHNGTIYRWNRPVYDIQGGRRTCGSRTGIAAGPTVAT